MVGEGECLMRALRPVPDTPPRAVLYLRQSVARDDSISIELQEIAGRDYCAQHGYEVIAVEVDEGISGRTWTKRPAVQRVMEMVEAKDADIIVLWKWSRLSRNRKDWAIAADRVDVAGGRIESATEPIDTATASGRFARGVMTEYAAFQSEQIGEQWAEAHRRRFELGLPPSGPIPFGWVAKKDAIEQHPENARIVRELYDMYFAGVGFTKMASTLNARGMKARRGGIWRAITISACLSSPIHAGLVEYRGELREGAHEGIITQDEWALFQQMRKDRHVPKKPQVSPYLLSSLVVCWCGLKRAGSTSRKGEKRYHSYLCPGPSPHPKKSLITWRADEAVGRWVKTLPKIAADPSETLTAKVDTEALSREITGIEKRLVKLTEHLLEGLVPRATYEQTRDALTREADRARAQLAEARTAAKLSMSVWLSGREDLAASWDILDFDARQELVRALIESVTINNDETVTVKAKWGTLSVIDIY